MNLEKIKLENLEIAKSKGFGITLSDISFPEKIALIHSEISEAYQALQLNNFENRHGFHEEIADVMLRLLHLAGILEINFTSFKQIDFENNTSLENMMLNLHNLISEGYEFYRSKKLDLTKEKIIEAVSLVLLIADFKNIDLEAEIFKKMEINKNRVWDKQFLNEEMK